MNFRALRKVVMVLVLAMVVCCFASEDKKRISEEELSMFFDSVAYDGTNTVFTFKKSGPRLVYSVNGQHDYRVGEYGESIALTDATELKVFDRHASLTISPLGMKNSEKGFWLSLKKDFRSVLGGVSSGFAKLVVSADARDLSAPLDAKSERRRFVGLKLLPIE